MIITVKLAVSTSHYITWTIRPASRYRADCKATHTIPSHFLVFLSIRYSYSNAANYTSTAMYPCVRVVVLCVSLEKISVRRGEGEGLGGIEEGLFEVSFD